MKKITIVCLAIGLFIGNADAAYTRGHLRRNGTYVSGYHHTKADKTRINNYSTRGNYNPFTGKAGTKPLTKYGY